MTARLASLSPRAQGGVIAGVLLVVALLGYFVLISPKRSTAADLKKQTAAVQQQIDQNRSTAFTKALPAVRAASIFKLTQAMPSQLDTPDVILQLNQLAESSGIAFDQIIRDYYADLDEQDIRACIQYAIDVLAAEDIHLATH